MKVRAKIPACYPEVLTLSELSPGDVARDGSIYLGVYQDSDWYVTATDAMEDNCRLIFNFNDAAAYAEKLTAHGHDDWIVPPGKADPDGGPDIMREMFNHKASGAFAGTYYESNKDPQLGSYWSGSMSASQFIFAYRQRFSDGHGDWELRDTYQALRCVRAVPRKQPS